MAIIDVPELAGALGSVDPPIVIDVRWRLGGPVAFEPRSRADSLRSPDALPGRPGRDDYVVGHIPGATFLDLEADLCGPAGAGGRHPLPDPDHLEQSLRAAGVRSGHPVVVYDGSESASAARAWWTLRWAGHEQVRVLDGGYAAWLAAGQPVETGEPPTRAGDIEVVPDSRPVLDADAAEALAQNGLLLDARVPPRFRGETEPIDPVAGHIPGAVNLPMARLMAADGRLLSPDELREAFAEAGVRPDSPAPVGAYCGSGVTAAHTLLALAVAGVDDVALYVGSWSNWVDDPLRPIATGEHT